MKRILSVILSVAMVTGLMSSMAFEAQGVDTPLQNASVSSRALSEEELADLVAKSHAPGAQLLYENLTRGIYIPTEFYNLTGSHYNGSAKFSIDIYSNYYFRPGADNRINIAWSVLWPQRPWSERQCTVTLLKKSNYGDIIIGSASAVTPYRDGVGYETVANSYTTFSNLLPGDYYFGIRKTSDGEYCDLSFYVTNY